MFGISDTTLAGIIGAVVLCAMMWLGLLYNNQAILGAAMGVVLPLVVAALGILSRSEATSVQAHQESLDKIDAAEATAARQHQVNAEKIQEVKQEVPIIVAKEMNK
jgi:hypothetical protein